MTSDMAYETFPVEVDGGTLHVGRWGRGERAILALHGITANHREFLALSEALGGDVSLIAPDQRGRGRSRDVGPEFSMADHADDAARVLDAAGVDRAIILGHSMGGFVTVVFGDRHAERCERLVLVDGGIPLDLGEAVNLPTEQLIQMVIGPTADRLRMTFPSRDAHIAFWKQHPSFTTWTRFVEDYVDYDLIEIDGALRSSCTMEAMLGSTSSQLQRDDIPKALENLRVPTTLLRAPRGLVSDVPLYAEAWLDRWAGELPGFTWRTLDDVNHFTALISAEGAAQVAEELRAETR